MEVTGFTQPVVFYLLETNARLWIFIKMVMSISYSLFGGQTNSTLDISYELRTAMAEEYAYEREPDDGEFYHKIRQHQQSGNEYSEDQWWARLSAVSSQKKESETTLEAFCIQGRI